VVATRYIRGECEVPAITLSTEEAIAQALLLHEAPASAVKRANVSEIVPVLMHALVPEDERDRALLALAESWLEDPHSLGRRVRDLAVELARRVAEVNKIDVKSDC
jgi:hypothetical protein